MTESENDVKIEQVLNTLVGVTVGVEPAALDDQAPQAAS